MTTHRERALGQARADLTALPDLCAEVARLKADRHHDITGYKSKVVGSPAPLQLPVVHLTDTRHKPGWKTDDPEYTHAFERYGSSPGLELWVKKLAFALPEYPDLTEAPTVRSEAAVLLEHWTFICQQDWAEALAHQIRDVTGQIKAGLGIPKAQRYWCPECNNPAYLVPGGILSCEEGHDRVVRDLEKQQRRRPPMSTKDVCAEFNLSQERLWQWKARRKITPTKDDHGKLWWLPWDVFCLLNPDIAEAVDLRDEAEAEHTEPA